MDISNQRIKNKDIQCLLLTFSIIFLTCSMVVTADMMSDALTIAWWVLCAVVLLQYNRYINKTLFFCFLSIAFIMMLSSVINGENIFNQIKILFSLFVVLLYVNSYSYENIINAYTKVVLFIATISIPLYFVCLARPAFLSKFIAPGVQEGHLIYNLYIFCFDLFNNRNSGLFWEPGAFTTFLNIALLLELLEVTTEDKKPLKRILTIGILIFANVLTFSTTGYLAMAIVLVIYLFSKTHSKMEKAGVVLAIVLLVFIVFNIYSDMLFTEGTRSTFGKLRVIFDGSAIAGNKQTSASVRIYSITKPFEIFLQRPLFGVGSSNLAELTVDYTRGAITCTFVNWFAIYGIFYGALMLAGYIKIVAKSQRNRFIKLLIFIFLMVSIISENYATNACFVGIALLGFKHAEEIKLNNRGTNEKQSFV